MYGYGCGGFAAIWLVIILIFFIFALCPGFACGPCMGPVRPMC